MRMPMRFPCAALALCGGARAASAPLESGWSVPHHETAALQRVADGYGCSPAALQRFFAMVEHSSSGLVRHAMEEYARQAVPVERTPTLRTTPRPRGPLQPADVSDDQAGRDAFLADLAQRGYGALDPEFFGEIHRSRMARMRTTQQPDAVRTVALMTWLEDLTRERLNLEALARGSDESFYWWNEEEGVFDTGWFSAGDYPYDDGDIIVTLMNVSGAHLICNSTQPPRWHSHAMLCRKRARDPYFVEAHLETGVSRSPRSDVGHRALASLVVARMAPNIPKRGKIVATASDIADSRVGAPYNLEMSLDTNKGYFCSSLVAASYADAASAVLQHPVAITNLLPQISRISSPGLRRFLDQFAIRVKNVPAPGDLLASQDVDVVAEYRDMDHLFESWMYYLAAQGFVDVLDAGYEVAPHPLEPVFSGATWIRDHVGLLTFIPAELSGAELATLASFEWLVFQPTIESLHDEVRPADQFLCRTPPWSLRGLVTHHLLEDASGRRGLRPLASHP